MQTTTAQATPATQPEPLSAAQTAAIIRKRLDRWQLDHQRKVTADLAVRLDAAHARIEALEAEVWLAQNAADSWRDDALNLALNLSHDLPAEDDTAGLAMDGQPVATATQQGGAA